MDFGKPGFMGPVKVEDVRRTAMYLEYLDRLGQAIGMPGRKNRRRCKKGANGKTGPPGEDKGCGCAGGKPRI